MGFNGHLLDASQTELELLQIVLTTLGQFDLALGLWKPLSSADIAYLLELQSYLPELT